MNKTLQYAYLQFPLCLQGETYKDRMKGMNLIFGFGIMSYAMKLPYEMNRVAMQAIYDYGRNHDKLQPYMAKCISDAIDDGTILYEDEFNGFDSKAKFNPDQDNCINPLLKLFDEDATLKGQAIINNQLHVATSKDHLNIEIQSNSKIITFYEEASGIKQNFERRYGPDAMPFCKVDHVLKFKNEQIHDLDLFRAYIAISSIIGRRNFTATNKPAILSRMIGCKNKSAFEAFSQEPHLRPTIEWYGKRYQMDNLLHTLRDREFIMYLSPGRRRSFYISKYMAPEELATLIKQSVNRYGMRERIKQATATL